mgnify:CR=1 FL=1
MATGKMICKKDIALRRYLMVVDMKVILAKAKSMARAPFFGKMGRFTKATGSMTTCMAMVCIGGTMAAYLKANGKKIICTDEVNFSGRMEDSMTVNTKMIKCQALALTLGLMANNTKASG